MSLDKIVKRLFAPVKRDLEFLEELGDKEISLKLGEDGKRPESVKSLVDTIKKSE